MTETFETWWDDPAVRVASSTARWPNCSIPDFLGHLVTVLEARDELAGRVDIVDLCGRILDVDADRDMNVPDRAVAHAMWALRQGLAPEVTADIFGLSEAELTEARKRTSRRDEGLRLYGLGRTVKQIAAELGVSETTVRKWLNDLDLEPNKARGLSPEAKETVKRLRSQGVGPKKIAQRLGLSLEQVKQVVYGDRHKEKAA